jgi:uncharacterized protein YdaU (DUF1376 family)
LRVNFYKRFVGDIQRKTGHLSCAEMGVYDRLLDHYYGTERALPGDAESVCRIARAMSKDERKAVDSVLRQFFTLGAEGYTQGRAEQEIADAQPKIAAARTNGKGGGRPRTNPTGTQKKPTGLSAETQDEPDAKASQSQSTSNEVLPPSGVQGARASKRCPADFKPENWEAMQAECPGVSIARETEKFRDWEFKTARRDWQAAWRTWMRKAFDNLPNQQSSETAYQRSMRQRAAEIHPAIARAAPGATNPNPMEILDGLTVARIAG